jgi:two-component system OmpR family sensor kinase
MTRQGLSASGLVIALVGFALTRFTVTLAATESTVEFLFAGIVPLVVGLALTVVGVMLAVGAYETEFVRTTAAWCVVGTSAMLVLVVLTLLGSGMTLTDPATVREQTYLSTFLIGGAVGGTLTGVYAARNRRTQRTLRQQANRLTLLNRLLRDRVINSATVIKGHHDILQAEHDDHSVETVGRKADEIIETVEDVKYLSKTAADQQLGTVDLVDAVEAEVEELRARYPDAEYDVVVDGEANIQANARVREVLAQLFENAVRHSDAETPCLGVAVETSRNAVVLRVSDNGPGLPDAQRALLERGEIAEFDDPTTGFGLNIVRLLAESFDAEIRTAVGDGGSTVELTFHRAHPTQPKTVPTPAVVPSRAALAVGVGLVAGVAMSTAMAAFDGDFLAIGSLYGIENPVVAHVTHEFHSVVFALVYAGVLSVAPLRYAADARGQVLIAAGFGLSLWLFAAGLVMPVWLELVGVPTPIPNLTIPSLIGHLVWGLTTGTLYHAGTLWLDRSDWPLLAPLASLDPR